jgi:hypothetical protein
MKKILFISFIILSVLACKKTKYEPEGPTDIRVKNSSGVAFTDVRVNISDTIRVMGDIPAGGYSAYIRFPKAYVVALITAKVSGQLYTTAVPDYTGKTYLGQVKITYDVNISDLPNKILSMTVVYPYDAPLK